MPTMEMEYGVKAWYAKLSVSLADNLDLTSLRPIIESVSLEALFAQYRKTTILTYL